MENKMSKKEKRIVWLWISARTH